MGGTHERLTAIKNELVFFWLKSVSTFVYLKNFYFWFHSIEKIPAYTQ